MNVEDVFFTVARDIKQRLATETDSKPEVQIDNDCMTKLIAMLSELFLGMVFLLCWT